MVLIFIRFVSHTKPSILCTITFNPQSPVKCQVWALHLMVTVHFLGPSMVGRGMFPDNTGVLGWAQARVRFMDKTPLCMFDKSGNLWWPHLYKRTPNKKLSKVAVIFFVLFSIVLGLWFTTHISCGLKDDRWYNCAQFSRSNVGVRQQKTGEDGQLCFGTVLNLC